MWHNLYIEDAKTACATSLIISEECMALIIATQAIDCAIFSRIDDSGGMHYFFTPPASAIAKRHHANQCEKPSRQDIGGLLCGDQTIIARLYC